MTKHGPVCTAPSGLDRVIRYIKNLLRRTPWPDICWVLSCRPRRAAQYSHGLLATVVGLLWWKRLVLPLSWYFWPLHTCLAILLCTPRQSCLRQRPVEANWRILKPPTDVRSATLTSRFSNSVYSISWTNCWFSGLSLSGDAIEQAFITYLSKSPLCGTKMALFSFICFG